MSNDSDDTDYEVGKNKPPKNTRFKKGKSGNPHGRPKCPTDAQDIINKVLFTPQIVRAQGKNKKMTLFEISMMTLMNNCCKGDIKNMKLLMSIMSQAGTFGRKNTKDNNIPVGAVVVPAGVPAEDWERLYGHKSDGSLQEIEEPFKKKEY